MQSDVSSLSSGLDVTSIADTSKILGDQTRLRMLYALDEHGELTVGELAALTGVQEATASQALRLMRAGRVVRARRDGRWMRYRVLDAHVTDLLRLACEHSHDGAVHAQRRPGA